MKIRFLTLNVWNGGRLWDNLEKFLRENTFDIMLFQEVFNGYGENLPKWYKTYDEFQKLFPEYKSVFGASFGNKDEYGSVDRGQAIFSKFPIFSSQTKFFDLPYRVFDEMSSRNFEKTPRVLLKCEVEVGNKKIHLFNHHGIWGKNGRDNARRLAMGKVIEAEVKDKENVILAGDFNMDRDTETVKGIEKYLENVFKNSLKTTFNMRQKTDPGFATAAVDMMFISSTFKVLEKNCPQVDVSDHLSLAAVLEI